MEIKNIEQNKRPDNYPGLTLFSFIKKQSKIYEKKSSTINTIQHENTPTCTLKILYFYFFVRVNPRLKFRQASKQHAINNTQKKYHKKTSLETREVFNILKMNLFQVGNLFLQHFYFGFGISLFCFFFCHHRFGCSTYKTLVTQFFHDRI